MARLEPLGVVERPAPSVTDSLDRVVDAAQNVVADQVELLRVEVASAVTSALHSGAMLCVGTALLALGWVLVLMVGFQLLAPRLGPLGALAVLAAINLIGGTALMAGARRDSGESDRG